MKILINPLVFEIIRKTLIKGFGPPQFIGFNVKLLRICLSENFYRKLSFLSKSNFTSEGLRAKNMHDPETLVCPIYCPSRMHPKLTFGQDIVPPSAKR